MIKHPDEKVELLAPAGDIAKLRLALSYGADAVYLGGGRFGLRAAAAINNDFLKDAAGYAHGLGKKIYVTVNIFARNSDFDEIKEYAQYLENVGVDAVIVSDLGVLRAVRENTNLVIHVSTQANVINKYAAEEYVKLGARRIILARECSLSEIREIAAHVKGKCDIEVFVHGAMCVSYSGRCLLSNYTTGRESNYGECTQPCRWKYALMEEKRPGQYFPVEEDAHGTYIMNSKDLCLINHLKELQDAGITSFKIEGRTKSEYYVAAVVGAYRRALDGERFDYMKELDKVAHRQWTTGFVLGENDHLYTETPAPDSTRRVVAMCLGGNKVSLRNGFSIGDELEILSPRAAHNKTFKVTGIKDGNLQEVAGANKAGYDYFIECPYTLNPDDFLRKTILKP